LIRKPIRIKPLEASSSFIAVKATLPVCAMWPAMPAKRITPPSRWIIR
jgi:hypothetical protein